MKTIRSLFSVAVAVLGVVGIAKPAWAQDGCETCCQNFATPDLTVYVKPGASTVDGTSWATAYPTLRVALAAIASTPGEVLVNVWSGDQEVTNPSSPSQADYLDLRSNLKIVGGWDNSMAFPFNPGPGLGTTYIKGSATGSMYDNTYNRFVGVDLHNIELQYLYFYGARNPTGNIGEAPQTKEGGALFLVECTDVCVKDCSFVANFCQRGGGAISLQDCEAKFTDCYIAENQAITPSPSSTTAGAGVAASGGVLRFERTTFYANNADGLGGGVFLDAFTDPVTFADCDFNGNICSSVGGALSAQGSALAITKTRFVGNNADVLGGAIYIIRDGANASPADITSTSFRANFVDSLGEGGGAIATDGITTVSNCSFADNSAPAGGAMYLFRGTLNVRNTVAFHNADAVDSTSFAAQIDKHPTQLGLILSILSSDISNIPGSFGPTNFSADPLFPMVFSDHLTGPLPGNSPLINFGNNALVPADSGDADSDDDWNETLPVDVQGLQRIAAMRVDIGAYEYGGCPCRNDYNGDGDIGNDADMEAFFACLSGDCCPLCPRDLNCDGDEMTDGDIEMFWLMLSGHGNCGE